MTQELPELDITDLRAITEGDPELERQLFALYFTTAEHCLEDMAKQAGPHGDFELWLEYAHGLKGASANIGATKMTALCLAGESAGTADKRAQVLGDLRTEYAKLKPHLLQEFF